MTRPIIGAQLYSVRDKTQTIEDLRATLKEIKKMGYNTCQLSGQSRDITAAEMRDALDAAEMECACTHIGFDVMRADIDKVIEDHKILGCAYPGIGGLPGEYSTSADGYREFLKLADPICKKLADAGMHFIYHNHAFEFTRFEDEKKTGLEILLAESPKEFQFELDVFWVQAGGGDPVDWIHRVEGRMDVAHIKEMNGGRQLPVMAPIGAGNLNWKKILAALEETGVKYAEVEQDNAVETDSLGCMRQSIEYLKSIGAAF